MREGVKAEIWDLVFSEHLIIQLAVIWHCSKAEKNEQLQTHDQSEA